MRSCLLTCLQLFYNIPRCDPLTQSTLSFSHVAEQTKDSNGVAWHTGSGYVMRLEALKSINGWPIESLNEDTLTSTLLLGAGWKTAYVHEALVHSLHHHLLNDRELY